MVKKTETPVTQPPKPPPELASIPELEPPDATPEPVVPTVHAAFARYPADMQAVAQDAYNAAIGDGMKEGDAVASAVRAVRKWARDNNRRMPE